MVQATSMSDSVLARLREAGIDAAALVRASPESASFADTEAVFRVAGLLLRFVRDRGQEFLHLAANAAPGPFHQFDDVEIAMGWKTIDQALAKREPANLSEVLARLSRHLEELDEAFSPERERFTRARVERAARDRGHAFMSRLREKSEQVACMSTATCGHPIGCEDLGYRFARPGYARCRRPR
jgi:hypothetical protein